MGSLNKVMLIGRLGQDPDIRSTDSGKNVANVSLATSDTWKDHSGQKQEKTEWHKLVMWDRLADLAQSYLKKGSQIYVEGSIQTRDYLKDDEKRYITEVKVFKIEFLSSQSDDVYAEKTQPNVKVPEKENTNETWHDRENEPIINRIKSNFIDKGHERMSQEVEEVVNERSEGVKDDIPF